MGYRRRGPRSDGALSIPFLGADINRDFPQKRQGAKEAPAKAQTRQVKANPQCFSFLCAFASLREPMLWNCTRNLIHSCLDELLTVAGLTKTFAGKRVLSGVNFTVRSGQVCGLIGPNGAGKTTLFECLAGLLPADHASVKHGDEQLNSRRRKEVLFYMPDAIVPWAEQRVDWVLNFFRKAYAQSHDKVRALSTPLRLDEIRKSQLGTLSKGERKRLMLGLGLLTPHPLLLLDEPFDGLDLRQTRDVMTLLKSEAAGGRALLLSIHQLVDAGRVCDRLVLLNHGETVAEGTIDELRARAGLADGGIEEIFLALT